MSSSSSSVFTLFIILFFLQTTFSYSSLLLPLSHSLSTTKFNTIHHLLKSVSTRSTSRFNHHRQVSLQLSPGTDYTISFSLGSQTISLYMDTGSDVVWLPCNPFDCILCEGEYSPSSISNPGPLNLTSATPITCKSSSCSAIHSSLSSSDLCAMANCPLETIEISDCKNFNCPPFYYAYGDGSFIASLYKDTLHVPMSSPNLKIPNFTFGCAHSALAEPIGVAGFGRGLLSLPGQLVKTYPEIGSYFSYCLVAHAFGQNGTVRAGPSTLMLGREEKKEESDTEMVRYKYTPLLDNPKHSYFYCVGLEGVSIEKKRIIAPKSLRRVDELGNGGMVVDSGTTFTMLPRKFYKLLVSEFEMRVKSVYKRASLVEEKTGLSPCYYAEKRFGYVPRLVLHFGGNSSVVMPRRNYFYEYFDDDVKKSVGCLMMMDGGDEKENGGGPAGLFGNYQQQGFEVVYDLELKRVGFARRKCASLWDNTLN